jgi:hypothetical protein
MKESASAMTEDLTSVLARRVMRWDVAPDRFLTGKRKWMPRWRFQPGENLEDAFRLLEAAEAEEYTLTCEGPGPFCVQVRIKGRTGKAKDRSKPRAITLAVCRALQIQVDDSSHKVIC